jgi:DNA-binding GntR family transcriptional regulator
MDKQETILPRGLFMDLQRSSPIPLYFQVSQRIEQAILSGDLPAGSRLENEVALGERLGLSRPTVRRAIQEIVDKGLLVRRRGIGTQVVHGQVTRRVELTSLYDELTDTHKVPSTRLLLLETTAADAAVADKLAEGSPTLHLRRVRLAIDGPVALMENWMPAEFIGIEPDDLVQHGLYQVLRSRGVTMLVARQHIGARASTPEESSLLDTETNAALLTMDRTAFDNSGRAVEFGRHCYRPDLYSFEVTLVEK